MKKEEEWKSIKGYEGLYEISSYGRVKSLSYKYKNGKVREEIIRVTSVTHGYEFLKLNKNGESKNYKIHRLVAEAFIPNPENKPEVDHIDTNKRNNIVENLRWVTRQENCDNPRTFRTHMIAVTKPILQYDLDGNFLNYYPSIAEASRRTGIIVCTIQNCLAGRTQTAKGFIWKYYSFGVESDVDEYLNKMEGIDKRKALEAENTEFDYGHNVKHYNED